MLNLGGNCMVEYVFIHFHGGNGIFRDVSGFNCPPYMRSSRVRKRMRITTHNKLKEK